MSVQETLPEIICESVDGLLRLNVIIPY